MLYMQNDVLVISMLIVWNVDVLVLSLMLLSCCNRYKCYSYYNYDDHGMCPCGVVQIMDLEDQGWIVVMIMACVSVMLFSSWIWMTRVELLRRSWRMSLWCCSDHGSGRPGLNCYNDHGMCPCGVVSYCSWIWMTRVELLRRSWHMSLWYCSDHGSGRPGFNCYNDHGMCPCGVVQIMDLEDQVLIVTMIMACVPVVLFRIMDLEDQVLLQWSWHVSLWCCSDRGSERPGFNCYGDHSMCPCGVQIVDLEDGILQLKEDLIQERTEARQEKKRLKRAVVSICSLSSLWLWCSVKESL